MINLEKKLKVCLGGVQPLPNVAGQKEFESDPISFFQNINASWQTGTPLGNNRFKEKIEARLKCKVGQARRGRPSKKADKLGGCG